MGKSIKKATPTKTESNKNARNNKRQLRIRKKNVTLTPGSVRDKKINESKFFS